MRCDKVYPVWGVSWRLTSRTSLHVSAEPANWQFGFHVYGYDFDAMRVESVEVRFGPFALSVQRSTVHPERDFAAAGTGGIG